ncbi:Fe(3+) ABC transporter substrate-binding protein [Porticoccus sp.]|uniref:Fe(3+) ABC transporter substrate-binding protein n=1 Tax=Porticoccus sp. TaxID=2024853 RepID=UPI003F69B96E
MQISRRFPQCILGLLLACSTAAASAAEVNLYSARIEALIKPLLDTFTEQTGIEVNLVTGDADGLIQRLKSEGRNSPADILLTTDVGRLYRAKEANLTQSVESATLEQNIPVMYRDDSNHWFGLSLRARPILYVKDKVDPAELSSYEDLSDPKWKGKICIRSSNNVYNQSMVASLIAANGLEATEEWAKGLVANFAMPPRGGDRDQIKAAAAGQCDLAIANTYYLAGMLTSDDEEQRAAAEKMAVFWPNQDGRGAHVNISGAAVTASAPNRDNAIALLEFLSTDAAQSWYARENGEYPIRDDIEIGPVLCSWGTFKADPVELYKLGAGNGEALRLMDRAGWR